MPIARNHFRPDRIEARLIKAWEAHKATRDPSDTDAYKHFNTLNANEGGIIGSGQVPTPEQEIYKARAYQHTAAMEGYGYATRQYLGLGFLLQFIKGTDANKARTNLYDCLDEQLENKNPDVNATSPILHKTPLKFFTNAAKERIHSNSVTIPKGKIETLRENQYQSSANILDAIFKGQALKYHFWRFAMRLKNRIDLAPISKKSTLGWKDIGYFAFGYDNPTLNPDGQCNDDYIIAPTLRWVRYLYNPFVTLNDFSKAFNLLFVKIIDGLDNALGSDTENSSTLASIAKGVLAFVYWPWHTLVLLAEQTIDATVAALQKTAGFFKSFALSIKDNIQHYNTRLVFVTREELQAVKSLRVSAKKADPGLTYGDVQKQGSIKTVLKGLKKTHVKANNNNYFKKDLLLVMREPHYEKVTNQSKQKWHERNKAAETKALLTIVRQRLTPNASPTKDEISQAKHLMQTHRYLSPLGG